MFAEPAEPPGEDAGDGLPPATLIATLTQPLEAASEALAALPPEVEWVEVRADLAGEVDPEELRRCLGRLGGRTDRKLLYTLRSSAEGGASETSPHRRADRIAAALEAGYDLVDLEAERDRSPDLLTRVPADRRVLSWHGGWEGGRADLDDLTDRFDDMARTEARLYKLVPAAREAGDGLAPLLLLHNLRRRDVIAFAMGAPGFWTRLLAPRLGAPVVYGALSEAAAPGQPSVATLIGDYGLPAQPTVEALCAVVGDPALHSLSPRLHNGAYRRLGIPYLYLPIETHSFADFWLDVVEGTALDTLGFPLKGLSVTAPFKPVALAVAGAPSPLAQRVGVANTLVEREGVWEAELTDPDGVVDPLRRLGVPIEGSRALVVGAGGAGRAAALGLTNAGAKVTLANRSRERGEEAAEDLRLPFVPLDEVDFRSYRILVHATSLGRRREDDVPVDVEALAEDAVLVDLVYTEEPTPLLLEVRARGLRGVDGREVLLGQARGQFRMMTGRDLPAELGEELLGLRPAAEDEPAGQGGGEA